MITDTSFTAIRIIIKKVIDGVNAMHRVSLRFGSTVL
jgi:hypothetical protein